MCMENNATEKNVSFKPYEWIPYCDEKFKICIT